MGIISLQRKIPIFPQGSQESGACTHLAEFTPGLGAKFGKIAGAKVDLVLPPQMDPAVFQMFELRRVARQLGEVNPLRISLQAGRHHFAWVRLKAAPDDDQWWADLAAEFSEEMRGLQIQNRPLMQPGIGIKPSDPNNHTEVVPPEAELKLRGLAHRSPSTDDLESFSRAGFAYEEDHPTLNYHLF